MYLSFEKKLTLLFSIILIGIIAVGVATYLNHQSIREIDPLVIRNHEVLNESLQVLSKTQDMVLSSRGYAITGDSGFLEPFMNSNNVIGDHVNNLKDLINGSSTYKQRIGSLISLINERKNISLQTVEVRNEEGFEGAQELIASGQGKMYMDEIRNVVMTIQEEENIILKERMTKLNKSLEGFGWSFYALLGGLFILLVVVFIAISMEISSRKKAEASLNILNRELEQKVAARTNELMSNEVQFKRILDNMMEGFQVIDSGWRYHYINDAAAKHGKYSKDELLGRTMMEMYPGIEQTEVFRACERCMKEQVYFHMENQFQFPDKSVGWFELFFQPVPVGIAIFSMDITERKKHEEEIIALNASLEKKVQERTAELMAVNKELESFTYSVAHDLRAPLRTLNGYAHILVKKYAHILDTEAKNLMRFITNSAKHMGDLIEDLLRLSHIGRKELEMRSVDMNELVESVLYEQLKSDKSGKIEAAIVDSLPLVECDPGLIRQVWVNLISNAIKYSAKKEQVKIEIGCIPEVGGIYYVKDNGAGFDMKYADRLFGVFQRLHGPSEFEGTGVGLAIVQRIVAKHGGKIWAEAEVDKGATFYFNLAEGREG